MIAEETGVALVADPLGGSGYVEWMTDEMERRAEEILGHIDGLGGGSMLEGVYRAIEDGWFEGQIAEASADFERRLATAPAAWWA